MNKFLNNSFGREQKILQECPVCHSPRLGFRANVLEEGETNQLLYLTCPHCQSSIIMLISLGIFGVDSIGLLTDLSALEVMRYKDEPSLTANDLINLHQRLINNNFINNLTI